MLLRGQERIMRNLNYLAKLEIMAALAGMAVGLGGIISGQPVIRQYLYFFAWYPYILLVDGLGAYLTGESWLVNRPRQLLRMGGFSITVWLVFEALNLVLKNWGYVGVVPLGWLRWTGYGLAFATVLPGILLTARLLKAWGAFAGVQGRSRNWGRWQPVSLLLGTALLVLPLVFPGYLFPLIWGAFFFLLDPFCQLFGGESLIQRFAGGERREHLCLLAAGLICGLWWESWNYWATSQWVYIFPLVNFAKVFEMPVLGFLGFPPFALEAAVMYNFLTLLDETVLITPRQHRAFWLAQVGFWLAMFAAMDAATVISFQ
jgi:hypothetical protein